MKKGSNIAASVHARLLAGAQHRREDFNRTLQRYTAERFLYRLGASRHRDKFVLKGAMLFALWGGSLYRATRDLDLTGYIEDNPDQLVAIVQEICAVGCPSDGLDFLVASVCAEPIRDQAEYHGLRVKVQALLGTARLALQIDVGFGDAIEPPPQEEQYPTLLDAPAPRIRAYPREAVVAEKLHAMVIHGIANSRYKDFYDVFVLATHFSFAGTVLLRGISATFTRRSTPLSRDLPSALTSLFYEDVERAAEWRRYLIRDALPGAPIDFEVTGTLIQAFINPPWNAIVKNESFDAAWPKGGPWGPAS